MESRVLDSRERKEYVYRLRKCRACGFEYVTHEIYSAPAKKNSPRVMYPSEAREWTEAVWLEYKEGRMTATSICEITADSISFGNGITASLKTCFHQWRIWNKKPTDLLRRTEKWR